MDIDVMGKHIHGLLSFKDKIEGMIAGAPEAHGGAHDELGELLSFKADVEAALPEIRKALADAATLVDDIATIKKQLEPVLDWVAEQQKNAEAAKTADKPQEAHVEDADKPLAHLADIEEALADGAESVEQQPDHVDVATDAPAGTDPDYPKLTPSAGA